jgi:hypothetical protein
MTGQIETERMSVLFPTIDPHDTALWAKKKELEMLKEKSSRVKIEERWYFDGKAIAFSEIWEKIVFGGYKPSVEQFNQANEEWSILANET